MGSKELPNDNVASCLHGGNGGKREFETSAIRTHGVQGKETDNSKMFGLTTAEVHALYNPDCQPHMNSFEIMAPKEVGPGDVEVDDYTRQRTKDEVG